jgi:collagen type I alpha
VYTMTLLPAIGTTGRDDMPIALQNFDTGHFVAIPDLVNNATTIIVSGIQDLACFRGGTRISTPDGPVAVEDLSSGDLVTTHFGGTRRVVWIGHREVNCRRHSNPRSVWPVRILPNAFAPGQPHGELFLSPDHAVFVDGVLIPIRLLINGTTIRPIEASRVTWYHVELEEHDVLFAEGLAAESYLDQNNREFFANGGTAVRLFPDFTARTWEMAGCAPLVVTGVRLAGVRAMVEKRALNGTPRAARYFEFEAGSGGRPGGSRNKSINSSTPIEAKPITMKPSIYAST